jgi:membrane fusion protein (multidrug efflux system)
MTGQTNQSKGRAQAKLANNASIALMLRRKPYITVAIAALAAAAAIGAVVWWHHARQYVTTGDAFIDARTVSIAPQINGVISSVPVTDNQLVEAGAVLVRIDDRDYRAALDQAKAQVDQAEANIGNLAAQIAAQEARIDQAEKEVVEAQTALRFS